MNKQEKKKKENLKAKQREYFRTKEVFELTCTDKLKLRKLK